MYSLSLVFFRFFDCLGRHGHIRSQHFTCLDKPTQIVNIIGLFVESILFGLFTSCMMFDQSGVVLTKITNIDRLKGGGDSTNGGSTALSGVIEVFGLNSKKGLDQGGNFRADWLSPFHRISFPVTLQDEIMGFCKPCTTRMNCSGKDDEIELSSVRNVANIV